MDTDGYGRSCGGRLRVSRDCGQKKGLFPFRRHGRVPSCVCDSVGWSASVNRAICEERTKVPSNLIRLPVSTDAPLPEKSTFRRKCPVV